MQFLQQERHYSDTTGMLHTILGNNGPQAHYKLLGRHVDNSFPIIRGLISSYNSPLVKIFDPSSFSLYDRQRNIPFNGYNGREAFPGQLQDIMLPVLNS